jgi:hypothetical protein
VLVFCSTREIQALFPESEAAIGRGELHGSDVNVRRIKFCDADDVVSLVGVYCAGVPHSKISQDGHVH